LKDFRNCLFFNSHFLSRKFARNSLIPQKKSQKKSGAATAAHRPLALTDSIYEFGKLRQEVPGEEKYFFGIFSGWLCWLSECCDKFPPL
jgi:hypothetical protein